MIVDTQQEAAKVLGVSDRQLRNWSTELGFPARADGKYDVAAIAAWREQSDRKGSPLDDQLKKIRLRSQLAKMRSLEARATKDERERDIAEGNILERDEYETFIAETITLFRDTILPLSATVARLVPAKVRGTVKKEVDSHLRSALQVLSDRMEAGPDGRMAGES